MRRLFALSFFSIFALVLAQAADSATVSRSDHYTELRMNFAKRPGYDPMWDHADDRKAIFAAFKASESAKVVSLGNAWLEKIPVDAEVHLLIGLASMKLGDFRGYSEHLAAFYGFLQSITSTGDGRTPTTAFKVIAVAEEYTLLRDIGAQMKHQSLVGGCDKLEVEMRDGTKHTLYFDVSISIAALNRLLSPGN